jgi:hypothetical protein
MHLDGFFSRAHAAEQGRHGERDLKGVRCPQDGRNGIPDLPDRELPFLDEVRFDFVVQESRVPCDARHRLANVGTRAHCVIHHSEASPVPPSIAPRMLITGMHSRDDLTEWLGEEAVSAMTSGESQLANDWDKPLEEEKGGPFVETLGRDEFAAGTDASNIDVATREPFPTTSSAR